MSNTISFGAAIEQMKAGKRVRRCGWNGKGMWITLVIPGDGGEDALIVENVDPLAEFNAIKARNMLKIDPVLAMRTAQGTLQLGWLASQADILATDWEVLS
jgi:hypothetical protein